MQVRSNSKLKSPNTKTISLYHESKSKLFLSKRTSLDILFLLVLYVQHKSRIFLCKNKSTKIVSRAALPVNNSLAKISSLKKTTMPPPNYFWSFGKRRAKPGILNLYSRNIFSSFVSEIIRTSTFPLNSLTRRSYFFCKELIFRWPEKCDSNYPFTYCEG